ncbi:MAG: UDP-forming cellulose synthase catalytic subunit [Pseudomonadota bacterium]
MSEPAATSSLKPGPLSDPSHHPSIRRFTFYNNITLVWLFATGCFMALCYLPLQAHAQAVIANTMLVILFICYRISVRPMGQRHHHALRLVIIFIALLLSSRYMYWRATESLPMHFGIAAMVFGLILFLAECYGYLNSVFGFFINCSPLHRKPIPLPADEDLFPHVDVYIPTYNEDASILRPTVIAATQMRYPRHKMHVFLLDDGGTDQKCYDKDPVKADAARERAAQLRHIAQRYGAGYLTRQKNEHAKAGNINSALQHTSGELILILDCDHIPTEDFLQNTVGMFLADPKLFVVQTPHNFISPDPLERNLSTFSSSPAENELFYDVMQPGLDTWGASFFCGSAAVLRRSVLDRLGGIAGQTITEDAETTLDALGLGYSTAYLNRPMVSGLQPETYAGFIVQRVRWGQGMLQIFILKNPWTQAGLSFVQRLLYTNFATYWGFATSRLIMLLAPPVFLLFSINLCDATADDILIYAMPSLFASLITTQYFYGRVRWPFMSQLYEIIQSVYVTRGLVEVLRKPRSPSFQVTPKGEVLNTDFVSALAPPFYILLAFNVAGIIGGLYRYHHEPWSQDAVMFVLFWAFLDCALLLGALGITFERRQLRAEPRARCIEEVVLMMPDGTAIPGMATNASVSGAGITIAGDASCLAQLKKQGELSLSLSRSATVLHGVPQSIRALDANRISIGLSYRHTTVEQERAAIALAFGSSDQIIDNNSERHAGRSVAQGFIYVMKFAGRQGLGHLMFLLKSVPARLFHAKSLEKGAPP